MCRIEFLPVFKPDEFYCVEKLKENRRSANLHNQQRGSVSQATEGPPEPESEPESSDTSDDESEDETAPDLEPVSEPEPVIDLT